MGSVFIGAKVNVFISIVQINTLIVLGVHRQKLS
jgi:hypothetical protein